MLWEGGGSKPGGVKRDSQTRLSKGALKMDAPHTVLHGQNTTTAGRLYLACELGEKNGKLSLGDGRRAPTHCTVAAGDTTAVLTAIANARARCHLSADAPVYSCYEAGRDGFWLHRWLAEQGIVNLVVDSA